jgi:superfamily I DNA/RNA helicase
LNPAQIRAVLSTEKALLVRAQVGSGKTTVLAHKVLYLHFVLGVPLHAMAVLTFTNKAAREIRRRLVDLGQVITPLKDEILGKHDEGKEVDPTWLVGTFHGVARTLLAHVLPVERLGYRPDFGILDEIAREAMWESLIRKHRLRVGRRSSLRQRISALSSINDSQPQDLARLAELSRLEKQTRNVMDFDDLLEHATTLLREPACVPKEKWPPAWLLVDEIQDCDPRELEFLRCLQDARTHLFALGDPHQAIYGWRGSSHEVCDQVIETWSARMMDLPTNYRSTRTILEAARAVLGLQPGAGGRLVGIRDGGDPIRIHRHHDPVSEALYLCDRVLELGKQGLCFGEMAVLYRLRSQGEVLRRALAERSIPFLETAHDYHADSKDLIRLLTLHAAKGLEFRHVFICGANQGILPLGFNDTAEERRLLFVGITRARDTVEISYQARPEFSQALGLPSPYLGKIPASLVIWQEFTATSALPTPPTEISTNAHALTPELKPWSPGQKVRHPRYGDGIIITVHNDSIECDFNKLGSKLFSLRLCPLVSVY